MIRWRPDGTVIDTIALPIERPVATWHVPNGEYTIPFTPYQVGIFNSRGEYLSGFGGNYSLVVAAHGSDTARIIELPGVRAVLSPHVRDSVFAIYARRSQLAGVARKSDVPTEAPYFRNLYLDEHDNVWIERLGSDGEPTGFDVIDANGVFLGSVAKPAGMTGHCVFANGRLYATAETDDGDIVINVYRVDRRGT